MLLRLGSLLEWLWLALLCVWVLGAVLLLGFVLIQGVLELVWGAPIRVELPPEFLR